MDKTLGVASPAVSSDQQNNLIFDKAGYDYYAIGQVTITCQWFKFFIS